MSNLIFLRLVGTATSLRKKQAILQCCNPSVEVLGWNLDSRPEINLANLRNIAFEYLYVKKVNKLPQVRIALLLSGRNLEAFIQSGLKRSQPLKMFIFACSS